MSWLTKYARSLCFVKVVLLLAFACAAAQWICINACAVSIPEQVRILAEEAWIDIAFRMDESPLKADPDQGGSYGTLSPLSQGAYEKLYKGVWMQREAISFNGLSCDEIFEVFDQMKYDHPELFLLGDSPYACAETRNALVSHTVVTIEPEYILSGAELADCRSCVAIKVDELSEEVRSIEEDAPRARRIHDKLCSMVEYGDTEAMSAQAAHCAVGPLIEERAVCEGYALAYALLCRNAGLTCETIVGRMASNQDPSLAHAWNRVLIDGEWRYVDATFDDGPDISSKYLLRTQSFMEDKGYMPFEGNKLPGIIE